MDRLVATALAAVAFLGASASTASADTMDPRAERLHALAELYSDLGIFNGTVLLAHGETVVLERGYGMASYELAVPNGPETVFRVASLSKPVTALAVARLLRWKGMELETPLDRFVPEYPHASKIQIRQLLEHRSGVPHLNGLAGYERKSRHHIELDEIVAWLGEQPLDFEPGSDESYSNGGYALLALVVERISGRSYGEYIESEILAPLGMHGAGHDRHDLLLAGRATGYVPGEIAGTRTPAQYVEPSIKIGGGSLYATARDWLAFSRGLYGDNVVDAPTWRDLKPPRIPEGENPGRGEVWLTGRAPGFYASFRKLLDEDWTLIVLANNYSVNPIDNYLPAVVGLEPFELPSFEATTVLPDNLWKDFLGTYQWPEPWGTQIEIRRIDDRHASYVELFRNEGVGLFPQGDDGFYLPLYDAPCRFVRGEEDAHATHIECSPPWSEQPVRLERIPSLEPPS